MRRLTMLTVVRTCLLVVACNAFVFAQEQVQSPEASNVNVVKYSWSKDRIGWERDPFSGPIENFDEMRVRTRNEKRILDAKRGGSSVESSKAERDALTDQALINAIHSGPPARYGFRYKVSLQNKGTKEIRSIDWDYVFVDLINATELGRREFGSDQKIPPGKTKEFSFFIPIPPARRISIQALDKHERDGMGERIELVRVQYADGTVWQRPADNP